jgi:hypothetical protein
MKTSRRYTSEQQILDAIDKTHQAAIDLLYQAEVIEAQIKVLQLDGTTFTMNGSTIDDLRFESKKLRKQADYQVEKRAKKLGLRLSEFRTMLLPIPDMGGEDGVPMKLGGLLKS